MINKKWLWAILFILLTISLSGVYIRWDAEAKNNTYETAIPFHDIHALTEDDAYTLDDVLSLLKEAGLTTVSFNPLSLESLEDTDAVSVYTESELEDILRFSEVDHEFISDHKGYYVTQPDSDYIEQLLLDLSTTTTTINNQTLYYLSNTEDIDVSTPIGYNRDAINKVKEHDLNYILRVENDQSEASHLINQHTVDTLIDYKDEHFSNILFSGPDIIGYPEQNEVELWTKQLDQSGFNFYTIEFTEQKGLDSIARNTDYQIVRLHSIRLDDQPLMDNINQAIRAVKERNIRTIFLNLELEHPEENLESATDFLNGFQDKLPDHYQSGTSEPITDVHIPSWITAVVMLAGIIFTYIAVDSIFRINGLSLAASVIMGLFMIAYFLLDQLIIIQAFALIVAVLTPIFAVLATAKSSETLGEITRNYVKAIGITFIGIIIVIGLLNSNGFFSGIEMFRGVTLVYTVPILAVALFALWQISKAYNRRGNESFVSQLMNLAHRPVKYWHLIVLSLVAIILIIYYTRQGNFGVALDFELVFRQWLEDTLYVRPRTKEFLIGFPLYILALYVMSIHKIWGSILLVPGVIGFLSIVNTFSHFHIPLEISVLRTVYGVVIGFIIGLLFIYIFKKLYNYITKFVATRWS